jgi:cyclophilin family peptidyl-prolyl cis-trans isomerase
MRSRGGLLLILWLASRDEAGHHSPRNNGHVMKEQFMNNAKHIVLGTCLALLGLAHAAWSQTNATAATPAAIVEEDAGMPSEAQDNPRIVIETSMGTITAELWPAKAPVTVSNMLSYIDESFYDGTIFHRVINGFMIQGGGFTEQMGQKPTHAPIHNEASADAPNARGTLAMARTSVIDSATSQFFINLVDNAFLNHRNKTSAGFGYCAFGKVTDGMDVVDAIAKVPTGAQDVPRKTVVIKSIHRAK